MKRMTQVLFASAALACIAVPVVAQQDSPPPRRGEGVPPGGGARGGGGRGGMPQLSAEQLKAVYEAQATHVSKANGLNEEQTAKVVTAYQAARESQTKALADLRTKLQEERRSGGGAGGDEGGEGGGRRGGAGTGGALAEQMQQAMADINKTEREKFRAAIAEDVAADKAETIASTLGTFDRQWDMNSAAVVDLKLDAATQDKAMASTLAFSSAVLKARDNPDREAMREATTEARRKMLDEMKAILDEESFAKFQRAAGGRGMGGGEGQPRRRPPAGGEGTGGGSDDGGSR